LVEGWAGGKSCQPFSVLAFHFTADVRQALAEDRKF
jgi:hypothetical protein